MFLPIEIGEREQHMEWLKRRGNKKPVKSLAYITLDYFPNHNYI